MVTTPQRLILLLLALAALPAWAGLTARIDRAQLRAGESFQLIIEKSGRYDGPGPDLAPLEAQFDLLGSSRSSKINIVNGEMNASTSWTITLAPKRAGTLSVPPVALDGAHTPSFPIQVAAASAKREAPTDDGEAVSDLFLEVEVSPETPYLQAQVTYRLRIFRTIDLHDAALSEPEVEGAIVERLGDDLSYAATRDGRRYQVIERRYALFPQRSGPLKIRGPVLNAEIAERGGRRGAFGGLFTRTRPVQLKAEDRTLEVRPAQGAEPWLPADALTLDEAWSPEPPQWRVGEPVTRTLTLEARGLTGAHLPPIHAEAPEGLSGYPDQPTIENGLDEDRLVGRRIERIALVPNRPGPFTLPEIRLRWWDVAAGRARETVIPARTIQVLPAEGGADVVAPPLPQPVPAPAVASSPVPGGDDPRWRWLATVLGGLWLATLGLWWWQTRGRGEARAKEEKPGVDPKQGLAEARRWLKRACQAGDPQQARAAALAWGAARWSERPPFSLGELAGRLDDEAAAEELRALDRLLYHPKEGQWDGERCWARLAQLLDGKGESREKSDVIPPLYT